MGRSTAELVAFVLVFAALASIAHGLGFRGYLKPLADKKTKIRAQIARVHQQKTWVRRLNSLEKQAVRKLNALQPGLDALQGFMLRDEGDRLRVSLARDHAARDLPGLVITPAETAPAVKLTYRIPVDPNEQLARLKQTFSQENPRVPFPRWAVTQTIEVMRYSERVTVEAPLNVLMRFLMRIEAESLLVQVTELKLTLPDPETPESNLSRATVELSALSLPAEDATEAP